jgi:tungstate transport system substrate-binding protein
MKNRRLAMIIGLTILAMLFSACGQAATPAPAPTQPPAAQPTPAPAKPSTGCTLRLATTTSTADSGLLTFILPDFEKKNNCKVDVVAVGTGQAIEIGAKGDADVLLVHARAQEDKFVADGHAKERFDVMYNDFIVLGPKADPAKIGGMASAAEVFKAIAAAQAPFASRGDKSGTNTKELSLWASAGITPTKEMAWYNSLGQGMGETLLTSNEKGAYTLSDRGTYFSMKDKLPNLVVALGGNSIQENKDKSLLNPYGVLAVDPGKHPGVNSDMAAKFVQWIISADTQKMIGGYGVDKFGQPLFYPSAKPAAPSASSGDVALTITGLVEKELKLTMDAVKAIGLVKATLEHPKKGKTDYEGVKMSALLAQAKPKPEAKKVVLVASDGFTAEVTLDALNQCADCMMAFGDGGKIHAAMPGMESNAWVKDVIKIEVK